MSFMDILISSNLERLLYALSDGNDAEVRSYTKQLNAEGRYQVSDTVSQKCTKQFWAGSCGEEIRWTRFAVITQRNYPDGYPHRCGGPRMLEQYRAEAVTAGRL